MVVRRGVQRLLARMGAAVETRFDRVGFYPAGGGASSARVVPAKALRPQIPRTRDWDWPSATVQPCFQAHR